MFGSKLMIFGDSIMKGVMLDRESGRYKLCESKNFDSVSNLGVEVLNKSKMGATVNKGLEIIERSLDCGDGKCAVLLEYGGNDCDFDWKQISENPDGEFKPNVTLDEFRRKYREMIDRARAIGSRIFISSLIPIDADRYMNWISRGLSRENILKWLGDVSMLSRWQEMYNSAVVQIAAEQNCELIDIRTDFLCRHDFKELLCEDGIHPTQKGHDLIESALRGHFAAC